MYNLPQIRRSRNHTKGLTVEQEQKRRGRPRKQTGEAIELPKVDGSVYNPEPALPDLETTDANPIFTKQRNRVRDRINKLKICEHNLLLLHHIERILQQSQA